ncbi:hypothetical protein ALC53_04609, partial [Atta colombica]
FRTALRTGTTVLTEPEFDYVLAAPRLRGLRSRLTPNLHHGSFRRQP